MTIPTAKSHPAFWYLPNSHHFPSIYNFVLAQLDAFFISIKSRTVYQQEVTQVGQLYARNSHEKEAANPFCSSFLPLLSGRFTHSSNFLGRYGFEEYAVTSACIHILVHALGWILLSIRELSKCQDAMNVAAIRPLRCVPTLPGTCTLNVLILNSVPSAQQARFSPHCILQFLIWPVLRKLWPTNQIV